MTALRDIFTYALPGSVFLFASAVFLLLCAAALMWPRRGRGERTRHDGRGADRGYAPDASTIIRS
jgi:hypothetical protein